MQAIQTNLIIIAIGLFSFVVKSLTESTADVRYAHHFFPRAVLGWSLLACVWTLVLVSVCTFFKRNAKWLNIAYIDNSGVIRIRSIIEKPDPMTLDFNRFNWFYCLLFLRINSHLHKYTHIENGLIHFESYFSSKPLHRSGKNLRSRMEVSEIQCTQSQHRLSAFIPVIHFSSENFQENC